MSICFPSRSSETHRQVGVQPAGSQQLRQEDIVNATHRGPPFACPRRKDHTCHWRKAAVRLDVIIAGNVQDVKRPACCFQQALQLPISLIPTLFLGSLSSFKEHAAQYPYRKVVFLSFLSVFFFSQSYSATVSEGRLNCFPVFSMARLVARLVLLFWYLRMRYFASVCAGDLGSSPGFSNLGFSL